MLQNRVVLIGRRTTAGLGFTSGFSDSAMSYNSGVAPNVNL
jgi:hypothetical protein